MMDSRTIEQIKNYEHGLNLVKELQPVTYKKKGQSKTELGLVAQDVQKLEPKTVRQGAKGILSVDYESLVCILINSVKQLQSEVDQLKTEKFEKATVKEQGITRRKKEVV